MKNNFSTDFFWNLITKFFVIFIKIGTSIITARFLGPYDRGIYYALIQAAGLINTFMTISLGDGIIHNISKYKSNNFLLLFLFSMTFLFSSLIFLFLFFSEELIRTNFIKNIPDSYYLILFFLIPLFMFEYFASFALRGLKKFTTGNKISIFSKILTISLFLLFFFGNKISLQNAFYALISSYFITSIIYSFFIYKHSCIKFEFSFRRIFEIYSYSVRVHINNFLNEAEYRLDVFIILFFLSYNDLGIYSIGVALSQMVWYISNSVNTILFPYLLAEKKNGSDELFISKVIRYNFVLNFFTLLFIVIFGYWLVILLYGESYHNSYIIFLILAPGLLADGIARNIFTWIKSYRNPIILSKISLCTLFINIALNYFLIPQYGIYGAALTSFITYFLRAIITVIIFNNFRKQKINFVFFIKDFKEITFDLIKRTKKIIFN